MSQLQATINIADNEKLKALITDMENHITALKAEIKKVAGEKEQAQEEITELLQTQNTLLKVIDHYSNLLSLHERTYNKLLKDYEEKRSD